MNRTEAELLIEGLMAQHRGCEFTGHKLVVDSKEDKIDLVHSADITKEKDRYFVLADISKQHINTGLSSDEWRIIGKTVERAANNG